jgi:indoleamine 2,3-dioxygenase
VTLPDKYSVLQNLLDDMSIQKNDGSKGLLHNNDGVLESRCLSLPNYLDLVKTESEKFLIAALYRSYCFLASAYLLEPAYKAFLETGKYGVGRKSIPQNIAQPLVWLAEALDVYPFLEYSFGYSLGNYVRLDKSKGLNWDNLGMANKFSGMPDEAGFIMVHVDINSHTPALIKSIDDVLELVYSDSVSDKIVELRAGLKRVVSSLQLMNKSRQEMWTASRYQHYNDFRVFIMGITGNKQIFPDGVIYEPETKPRSYRGQSGSQDTIIPFLDTVFHVDDFYPNNDLTNYLMDMRSYRPKPFRDLLSWCKNNLSGFVEKMLNLLDREVNFELYKIYREIYRFRNGHWQFVQKYIMENTKYPVATGGTPITSWIPNQIMATLQSIQKIVNNTDKLFTSEDRTQQDKEQRALFIEYVEEYNRMCQCLEKQIEELNKDNYSSYRVYTLNNTYKVNDI